MDLIKELDHEQFFVKDRQGLVLLFLALRLGLNSPGYYIENFPINMIYRRWKNSDAQVTFFLFKFTFIHKKTNHALFLDVFNSTYTTKFRCVLFC